MRRVVALAWLAVLVGTGAACRAEHAGPPLDRFDPPGDLAEAALRHEEIARRAATDFADPPDARDVLGPDPIALVEAVGGYVALLATPPELVLLDGDAKPRSRTPAPAFAAALASDGAHFYVGSRFDPALRAFEIRSRSLAPDPAHDIPAFTKRGVRDLTHRGACLYGVDEAASELVWRCGELIGQVAVARGPVRVEATQHHVVVASPIGHAVSIFDLDPSGAANTTPVVVQNDGPLFAAAAVEDPATGGLFVASGGVEDRPLDRRGGSFGYVDSFVYVDRISNGSSERLATINVGELGVVTPKALVLELTGAKLHLRVGGYASEKLADITIGLEGPPEARGARSRTAKSFPGVVGWLPTKDGLIGPSPLLDALVTITGDEAKLSPISGASVASHPLAGDAPALRLGEALFYTTAMGPWQRTEGALSRFTCETCHFEGGVDGRIHATGRGDILATTKPLRGLGSNGPHFTRALDRDLTQMVFAEFRVAAANSGHDEWFDLDETGFAWPSSVPEIAGTKRGPASLRRALMLYLENLPHPRRPKPARSTFDPSQQRGARIFEQRCASCHEARLVTNDPATLVPPARWEALVLSEYAPIVWAHDGYEKTGVEPYVHPNGARPSSLRRIAEKTPYFTNGSAKSLEDVARGASWDDAGFHHAAGPSSALRLQGDEVDDLVAFLLLL